MIKPVKTKEVRRLELSQKSLDELRRILKSYQELYTYAALDTEGWVASHLYESILKFGYPDE